MRLIPKELWDGAGQPPLFYTDRDMILDWQDEQEANERARAMKHERFKRNYLIFMAIYLWAVNLILWLT